MSQNQKINQIPVVVRLLWLTAIATWLVGCSVPGSVNRFTPREQNEGILVKQTDWDTRALVAQVHRGVNQYRASRNLNPLRLNKDINRQAAIHSQNMAQQVVKFSHQGFEARIKALESQIAYRRAAENVAFNQGYQDPVEAAIAGWIKSQGHQRNMVGDFNLTGIGVARNRQGEYYFTQIFIKEN